MIIHVTKTWLLKFFKKILLQMSLIGNGNITFITSGNLS
jgi:hypothetical protein